MEVLLKQSQGTNGKMLIAHARSTIERNFAFLCDTVGRLLSQNVPIEPVRGFVVPYRRPGITEPIPTQYMSWVSLPGPGKVNSWTKEVERFDRSWNQGASMLHAQPEGHCCWALCLERYRSAFETATGRMTCTKILCVCCGTTSKASLEQLSQTLAPPMFVCHTCFLLTNPGAWASINNFANVERPFASTNAVCTLVLWPWPLSRYGVATASGFAISSRWVPNILMSL